MGSMALDGIGGYSFSTIIEQMMALERQTGSTLTSKQTTISNKISAYQSLNTKTAAVTSSALAILGKTKVGFEANVKLNEVWGAAKGSSTNATVSVKADPGANIGSIDVQVDQLAKSKQITMTQDQLNNFANGTSYPAAMSIVVGDKVTTIRPTTGSAQDIAKAINAAKDSGVKATAVRVGDGQYVLQVTGSNTGSEDGDFKIVMGDVNAKLQAAGTTGTQVSKYGDVNSTSTETSNPYVTMKYSKEDLWQGSGESHDFSFRLVNAMGGRPQSTDDAGFSQLVRRAQDAQVTLWAGSEHAQTVTSQSNTFEDIMDGVDITVGGSVNDANGNPQANEHINATINVEADPTVASGKVKNLITAMNSVLEEVAAKSKYTDEKRTDGTTWKKPGALSTDSTARALSDSMKTLMASGVRLNDGTNVSLKEFGITLEDSGGDSGLKLSIDTAKFEEAMNKDPKRVQEAMTNWAQKVVDKADSYSNSKKGILANAITSQESYKKTVGDQIQAFNDRMDAKETNLKLQFSRLQTLLSNNQSQMSWLQSQISSLPSVG